MAATISLVTSSRPEGLLEAAGRQATSIAAINSQIGVQQGAMTQLGGWEGSAATAARARADKDLARQRQLVGRLEAAGAALRSGGTNLTAMRTQILSLMSQAASLGGLVSDDGTVRPLAAQHVDDTDAGRGLHHDLKALLHQFDAVDQSTAQALNTAFCPAPQTPPTRIQMDRGRPLQRRALRGGHRPGRRRRLLSDGDDRSHRPCRPAAHQGPNRLRPADG